MQSRSNNSLLASPSMSTDPFSIQSQTCSTFSVLTPWSQIEATQQLLAPKALISSADVTYPSIYRFTKRHSPRPHIHLRRAWCSRLPALWVSIHRHPTRAARYVSTNEPSRSGRPPCRTFSAHHAVVPLSAANGWPLAAIPSLLPQLMKCFPHTPPALLDRRATHHKPKRHMPQNGGRQVFH